MKKNIKQLRQEALDMGIVSLWDAFLELNMQYMLGEKHLVKGYVVDKGRVNGEWCHDDKVKFKVLGEELADRILSGGGTSRTEFLLNKYARDVKYPSNKN